MAKASTGPHTRYSSKHYEDKPRPKPGANNKGDESDDSDEEETQDDEVNGRIARPHSGGTGYHHPLPIINTNPAVFSVVHSR